MATLEQAIDPVFKGDYVFVDEYLPVTLREEEVISVVHEEEICSLPVKEELKIPSDAQTDYRGIQIKSEKNDLVDSGNENNEEGCNDYRTYCPEECFMDSGDEACKQEKQMKNHSCYHCKKMFTSQDKMIRHIKLHHKENVSVRLDQEGRRCWVCGRCNKTFISRKGSIIHQRTHTGERPYTCLVCKKCFIDSSTLMKHQVIHQAVRPFTCHICKRGFNQKVALQRHERTHTQQQIEYTCKYCPKTFLVTSSLQAHEKIHSGIKPFTCNYCPSTFHTSTAQRQHERVHTNERPYNCIYCPKAFKDSGTLFKHQVIHSGVLPFVCPLCSQGFTQKVTLKKHLRSHVARTDVNRCELCHGRMFDTKDELYLHLEYHVDHNQLPEAQTEAGSSVKIPLVEEKWNPSEDISDLTTLCDVAISTARNIVTKDELRNPISSKHQYSCSECGMGFKRLKSLKAHLLGHSLMCKHCDKVYSDRSLLEEHERVFCCNGNTGKVSRKRSSKIKSIKMKGGKRQFYCEKCDKYFSSRNGFMIHQRTHTGQRPYGCRWCQKAFGDSATRHKHERIHTGERPFKCLQCPRAFNQRAALRAHQVTHNIDRAYVCSYCPSSFPYAARLERHHEACHKEEPWITACPICNEKFSNIEYLQFHVKGAHIEDPEAVPISCPLCVSAMFNNSVEFFDHVLWHVKQTVSSNHNHQLSNNNIRTSV